MSTDILSLNLSFKKKNTSKSRNTLFNFQKINTKRIYLPWVEKYRPNKLENIILLMPTHLISQTYQDLITKFTNILNSSSIIKLTNLSRYKKLSKELKKILTSYYETIECIT